ncbi:hypothetical protein Kpol_1013p15 [Vanderwaltozyma polyspora DSM 70294]|uniref:Sulfurtransferase n=1 Tax=Vanderwaltozyma polyspora (strain ATCC 22028 / DSM 70294 / BCRC 21397 / CBS 2163 / NBRC 10782 / NRRL Y-8283 / UCD 57-17) TaxID=436907 RepID=A7TH63_VANPO|nr:uncharacterized protein Kpol_1013p15 [Vanderwaltozyma polyspora DSM 70294]EDO18344.1 hypothetical protein Kpol_1013p15 [Vanderwaltozyma polyspora DSM 70294]
MSLYKLITPKAFSELLHKETTCRVIPVDATWFLPNLKRDGRQEFKDIERIPGSVFFDIDYIKDPNSKYTHMAPDSNTFNKSMRELGIKKDDILVVYDRNGNFSAPRVAWTIALFGHSPIYLLNNFQLYKNEGYPIDTTKKSAFSEYPKSDYTSEVDLRSKEIVSYEELVELVKSGKLASEYNAFDARSLGRFEGRDPEPRADMPSGHISGSDPLPYPEVLNEGVFPSTEEANKDKLNEAFKKLDIEFHAEKPTIVMCGSGVTSIIIKTALEQSGAKDVRCFDGSWIEWVSRSDPSMLAVNRD